MGDEDGYADRSFGNLPDIQTIVVGELNAYDILISDWVVFTDDTLPGGAEGPGRDRAAGTDTAAVSEESGQGADRAEGADSDPSSGVWPIRRAEKKRGAGS